MNRRSLLGSFSALLALPFSWASRSVAESASTPQESPVSLPWIKERLERIARLNAAAVTYGHVHCGDGNCPPGPATEGFRAHLFTARHHYAVVVEPHYLGCVMSNREPLPGEDWTRGRDLADGKLTAETWERILGDIVAMELTIVTGKTWRHIPDV